MEDTGFIGEKMAEVLEEINGKMTKEDTEKFSLLQTDDLRAEFLLNQTIVHDALVFEATYEKKSPSKAKRLREEGNGLFKGKEYRRAVEVYNQSVMAAPTPETREVDMDGDSSFSSSAPENQLSLALANRSASLFHLQKYKLCLNDIDLALQNGYPKELQYKLYERKAKCYMQLKNSEEARDSLQRAHELLAISKLSEKAIASWRTSLDKLIKQCELIIDAPSENERDFVLPVVKEASSKYPHASKSVDVQYKADVGRHLIAASNITVGDMLMSEKPYVAILLPQFYENHCYHCQRRLLVGVPDHQCAILLYCNNTCRQNAWNEYHSIEYGFHSLLGRPWCGILGQLVFRIARKVGYKKLITCHNDSVATPVSYDNGVLNDEGTYEDSFYSIYNMVTNIEKRVPEGLIDFGVTAVFLTRLLQQCGYFDDADVRTDLETTSNSVLVTVTGVLLRLLQIAQCNSKGIIELLLPTDFEDPKPTAVGMGMYPTVALINHSCDPSAVTVFHGNQVVVKATRNIKKAQEATIDYGMVYYRNVLSQRRMNLSLKYSFDCRCYACVKNLPLWRDLDCELPPWRCEECGAELNVIKVVGNSSVRCDRCNHLQDLNECMTLLSTSHDLYSKALEEATKGNLECALPALQGHLSLCQKLLLPPWRDLVAAQAAVYQCFRLQGNIRLL